MTIKAPTPCLRCHTLGDCEHRGEARRTRSSRAWTMEAADVVARWVEQFGWWCPGWGRAAHHATNLQADHVDSLAIHGDTGRRQVLCAACNAAKGAR